MTKLIDCIFVGLTVLCLSGFGAGLIVGGGLAIALVEAVARSVGGRVF